MAQFVRTNTGGWVNLDHVVQVSEEKGHVVLWGAGEEKLGTCLGDAIMEGVVVPAAAGAVATVFYGLKGLRSERPTEEDLLSCRVPIAAWQVSDGTAKAILPDDAEAGGTVLIELADGGFLEPWSATFPNLASAKAEMLERAQKDWDREQQVGRAE